MKRVVSKWFEDLEVTTQDIEKWYATEGKFCSGCIEGKLKEHARKTSTKPLTADKPGGNRVGDLMFIEGRSQNSLLCTCRRGNQVNYRLRA